MVMDGGNKKERGILALLGILLVHPTHSHGLDIDTLLLLALPIDPNKASYR
jgi:hypothetical protein